jgi:putative membrane protein
MYSNPPIGVPSNQAEFGSKIMYYGGDIVEISLISILFLQWFKATRPQKVLNLVSHDS